MLLSQGWLRERAMNTTGATRNGIAGILLFGGRQHLAKLLNHLVYPLQKFGKNCAYIQARCIYDDCIPGRH
jgi:hypothetical protein